MRIIVALALTVAAPFARADCADDVAALRDLRAQAPSIAAARYAESGDLRYLEWFGLYGWVPGIKDQECVNKGGYLRRMVGTTDDRCSPEHALLNKGSEDYALRYNEAMAKLRVAKGLPSCDEP